MNELPPLWRPFLSKIAETMNEVKRVRWDRCIDGGELLRLYGWFDRPDDHADFVILDVEWRHRADPTTEPLAFFFSTSSADPELSAELAKAIGIEVDDHAPCQRIEEVFGGLVTNAVKLDGDRQPSRTAELERALRNIVSHTGLGEARDGTIGEIREEVDRVLPPPSGSWSP